jgi:hypothetical protein
MLEMKKQKEKKLTEENKSKIISFWVFFVKK